MAAESKIVSLEVKPHIPSDVVQSFADAPEIDQKLRPPTSDTESFSPATRGKAPYYIYGESPSATTYPVSFSQNLFGANTDVVGRLGKIEFKSSFDGSLQNAIAYIVPWKRTGFNSRTPANPTTADTPASQNFGAIELDLGIDFAKPSIDLDTNLFDTEASIPVPQWDVDSGTWNSVSSDYNVNVQTYFPTTDVKGNKPTAQSQANAGEKQKALGSEIPMGLNQGILAGTSFLAGSLLQDNPRLSSITGTGINQIAGKVFNVPSGPIYIGNENGILNQAVSGASSLGALFGVNVPRGLTTTVLPDRQPKVSKSNSINASITSSADGAWQFLFNPSELGLSLGPKYSESETWGVMDPKEAGTPLQFQRMSNPKLKFSGIKLNGYVFGRQVEDLEQGIFKLLMTAGGADNGASGGPQVLEFVWGKKTFGPCVIKDISITEKMWDNGLLVNADLNFTLEKIPEWTVNDGQVSVYAPGSQGSQPTQTAPEEQNEETPKEKETLEPAPDEKNILAQCKNLKSDKDLLAQGITKVNSSNLNGVEYNSGGFLGEVSGVVGGIKYIPTFVSNLSNYKNMYTKYSSNSFYKEKIGGIGSNCIDLGKGQGSIIYSYEQAHKNETLTIPQKGKANEKANKELLKCYKNMQNVVDKEYSASKCSKVINSDPTYIGPSI